MHSVMKALARNSLAGLLRSSALAFLLFGSSSSFASELIDATRAGDEAIVSQLIAAGADLNEATGDGMTAVHWAAQLGRASILSALLEAGAEVSATTRIGNYTPLHLGSRQADSAIVEALLAAGRERQCNH